MRLQKARCLLSYTIATAAGSTSSQVSAVPSARGTVRSVIAITPAMQGHINGAATHDDATQLLVVT